MHIKKKQAWCNNSEKYFEKDAPYRVKLHKRISKELLETNKTRILDYGGGDGSLFRELHKIRHNKTIRTTLYDIDCKAIEKAKNNLVYTPDFAICDINLLFQMPKFDAIVLSNVIMTLDSEKEFDLIIKHFKTLLNDDGLLYVAFAHPCFLDKPVSSFSNQYSTSEITFNYLNNGQAYKVYLNNELVIFDFFWNLSFIINKFLTNRFSLKHMIELEDTEQNSFTPFMILNFNQNENN